MQTFKPTTLSDWLLYIEHTSSSGRERSLTYMYTMAKRLGVLNIDIPVITVGGTNGKGSTVAALEAIYVAADYQVGVYTSPHLLRFNERISVNGVFISDKDLCALFEFIDSMRQEVPLTYFEWATLAALCHFKQHVLDVIVLEVGIGGRLDATNIIDATLAIITTIDLDHQAYLGNTREAIGREKAGILRPNTPCIYADVNPPASILATADALKAPVYRFGVDYGYAVWGDTWHVTFGQEQWRLPCPRLHLNAAAAALVASQILRTHLPLQATHYHQAMASVFIRGRQQVIPGEVTTIVDVAHNPQAVLALAAMIQQRFATATVHAVFSACSDKAIQRLISDMKAVVHHWYPARLSGPRAIGDASLLSIFQAETDETYASCYASPLEAYKAAVKSANPGDVVVVYGSFLMVAPVLKDVEEQINEQMVE